MFKIDSTKSIKMTKGDEASFTLFINKGTVNVPIRYGFSVDTDPLDEVYFYLMFPHESCDEAVLKKTFVLGKDSDGNVIGNVTADRTTINNTSVQVCNNYSVTAPTRTSTTESYTVTNILTEEKDMILSLVSEDTTGLPTGKYYYQVKAKVINSDGVQELNTVTNKYPFYLLED